MSEPEPIKKIIERVLKTIPGSPEKEEEHPMSEKTFTAGVVNFTREASEVNEVTTQEQVLKDIGELVGGLIEKITENVDETQEKASFSITCVLSTDKEGNHQFEVGGKVSLNTQKITRGAKIIERQLKLFGM